MRSLAQLQDMTDTWSLITGGAGHVGQAAAETILELGGRVVLLDRHDELLTKVHRVQFDGSDRVKILACDLSDEAAIRCAMERVAKITENKLHVLINNAAFVGTDKLSGWCVPFEQQAFDTFKACLDVNLSAPFLLSQLAYGLMKKTDHPLHSVINISSIYGVVGPQMDMYEGTDMGNPAAYAASKAGLMQLTRWMSAVAAPEVRVNNILLGGLERGQPDSFLAKYNSKVPLGRMGREEDVKGAIAYLSSQLSNYMTGQTLYLDGGWTAV